MIEVFVIPFIFTNLLRDVISCHGGLTCGPNVTPFYVDGKGKCSRKYELPNSIYLRKDSILQMQASHIEVYNRMSNIRAGPI